MIDKLKCPIKLIGEYYYLYSIETNEMIKGKEGEYLLINLQQKLTQKKLNFISGKYIVDDFNLYQNAIAEFGENVVHELSQYDHEHQEYMILIKGSADALGNRSFLGYFVGDNKYENICVFPKENNLHSYKSEIECHEIFEPFKNDALPNLRASFIKEKIMLNYPSMVDPVILDGNVSDEISAEDRNVLLILYLPETYLIKN